MLVQNLKISEGYMAILILITHAPCRQIWSWQHSSTPPKSSSQKHPRKSNHNSSAHTKAMLVHLLGWQEVCSCSCVSLLAVTCRSLQLKLMTLKDFHISGWVYIIFAMAIKIILRFACLSFNCSTSCKFIGRYLLRYTNRIKHRGNIAPRLCQHAYAVTNEPYTLRGCTINIVT